MVLLSYIVKEDYGFAPNPYWGTLTLTVCKSPIRIEARKLKDLHEEFWIIGTGSVDVQRGNGSYKNYSKKLIFAMKVSKIMTLREYDSYCSKKNSNLKNKIPKRDKDLRIQVGDCIYRYPINGTKPIQRPGLHCSDDMEDDLKGKYALLSDEFYYFGANAVDIPPEFYSLIMKGQGYLKSEDEILIQKFLAWLINQGYTKNSVNGNPQLWHKVSDKFLPHT